MDVIDLPKLVTQILGFLIVVWILGKYAWPVVLGQIDARQHKIETDLRQAEFERQEAEQLKANLDQELKGIEAKARARIQEAVGEGQRLAGEIKATAQREATGRLTRVGEEIERERDKAAVTLKNDVVRLAIGTSEKILRQKLDEKEQQRLVDEFIEEVNPGR
jgi:F-type H+-transporting ATPase subunit b